MRSVYKPLSPYGFEQIILEDGVEIPVGHTEIEPPVPNWKPVFNPEINEWQELASEEDQQGSAVDDPNEIEQLKKENAVLQKQITDTQLALAEVYEMMLSGVM